MNPSHELKYQKCTDQTDPGDYIDMKLKIENALEMNDGSLVQTLQEAK